MALLPGGVALGGYPEIPMNHFHSDDDDDDDDDDDILCLLLLLLLLLFCHTNAG